MSKSESHCSALWSVDHAEDLASRTVAHLDELLVGVSSEDASAVVDDVRAIRDSTAEQRLKGVNINSEPASARVRVHSDSLLTRLFILALQAADPGARPYLATCFGEDFESVYRATDLSWNSWVTCIARIGLRGSGKTQGALFRNFKKYFAGATSRDADGTPGIPAKRPRTRSHSRVAEVSGDAGAHGSGDDGQVVREVVDIEHETPKKRGPGRPRKHPVPAPVPAPAPAPDGVSPTSPRSNVLDVEQEGKKPDDTPTRRVGRPRKHPVSTREGARSSKARLTVPSSSSGFGMLRSLGFKNRARRRMRAWVGGMPVAKNASTDDAAARQAGAATAVPKRFAKLVPSSSGAGSVGAVAKAVSRRVKRRISEDAPAPDAPAEDKEIKEVEEINSVHEVGHQNGVVEPTVAVDDVCPPDVIDEDDDCEVMEHEGEEEEERADAEPSDEMEEHAPRKCPAGHFLQRFVQDPEFSNDCDACGRAQIKAPEAVFRCTMCDFDLCQDCYNPQASKTASAAADPTGAVDEEAERREAEKKVRRLYDGRGYYFEVGQKAGENRFLVSFGRVGGGEEAARQLAIACCLKKQRGATLDSIRKYRQKAYAKLNTPEQKAKLQSLSTIDLPSDDEDDPRRPVSVVPHKVGPQARIRLAAECSPIPPSLLPADATLLTTGIVREEILPPVGAATETQCNSSTMWPGLGAVPADLPSNFNSVLILGASGSGKSSLLRTLLAERFPSYKGALLPDGEWPPGRPIIEGFPDIDEGIEWLCATGFSAVPAWCKPFNVLARGEQYRVNAARKLATRGLGEPAVFDEWTSDLDRGVARAASLALAKALRRQRLKREGLGPVLFASCHDDVSEHLVCDVVIRCEVGAAPRVVSAAGSVPPPLPEMCASFRGFTEPPSLRGNTDEAEQHLAIVGRWVAYLPNGRIVDLKIRPGDKRERRLHVTCRGHPCNTITVTEQPRQPMPPQRSSSQVSLLSKKFSKNLSGEGACISRVLQRLSSSTSFGSWYEGESAEYSLRLRATDTMVIEVQITSKSTKRGADSKVEMLAEGFPCFSDWCSIPSQDICMRAKVGTGGYSEKEVARLRENGWHIPRERAGEEAEIWYHGLHRLEVRWLGKLGADGRGFRLDPAREPELIGRTYLAAYVGEGQQSPGLAAATRFMDTPFDGLAVHMVATLPPDAVDDFGVAAVVGPSGSGKTSLVHEHFGAAETVRWHDQAPVRAHLPPGSVGDEVLAAVCLAPDIAARPLETLSGGEQFRANLARRLTRPHGTGQALILDDFASVLDRAAARRLGAYIQAYIRSRKLRRVVIVSCHNDFIGEGMLEPDWLFETHSGRFLRFEGSLERQRRELRAKREAESQELVQQIRNDFSAHWSKDRQRCADMRSLLDEFRRAQERNTQVAETGGATLFSQAWASSVAAAIRRGEQEISDAEAWASARRNSEQAAVNSAQSLFQQHYEERERELEKSFEDMHTIDTRTPTPASADARVESVLLPLHWDRRRLDVVVRRALPSEWINFREHHYKDHTISSAVYAFVACLDDEPVGFISIIPAGDNIVKRCVNSTSSKFHAQWQEWQQSHYPRSWLERELYREHRTVVMPCYQGIGIGSLLADCVARLCELMGYAFVSMTVHPQYGGYRDRSPFWSALPTNRVERSALGRTSEKCLKFAHAWKGATKPDGTIDAEVHNLLRNRVVFSSLTPTLEARVELDLERAFASPHPVHGIDAD